MSVEQVAPTSHDRRVHFPDSYFQALQIERWAITLRRRRVDYLETREMTSADEEVLERFEQPGRRVGWIRQWLQQLLHRRPSAAHQE